MFPNVTLLSALPSAVVPISCQTLSTLNGGRSSVISFQAIRQMPWKKDPTVDNIFCDVIGCDHPASWVYRGRPSPQREEYLCEECYHALSGFAAASAKKYIPLDSLRAVHLPQDADRPQMNAEFQTPMQTLQ